MRDPLRDIFQVREPCEISSNKVLFCFQRSAEISSGAMPGIRLSGPAQDSGSTQPTRRPNHATASRRWTRMQRQGLIIYFVQHKDVV
jgi:hypothetical protein